MVFGVTEKDDAAHFDGAKVAILRGSHVLTLLRDDIPSIPFPNMWDLPGGGREGCETPFETVARELFEELALVITPAHIVYQRAYKAQNNPDSRVYFFVARWDDVCDTQIILGDEGQAWQWMQIDRFIAHENAIPSLQQRLTRACEEMAF